MGVCFSTIFMIAISDRAICGVMVCYSAICRIGVSHRAICLSGLRLNLREESNPDLTLGNFTCGDIEILLVVI